MRRHWRILGISLLALIGVLAMNASAAQAKWLILVELKPGEVTSVKEIKLKSSAESMYLLPSMGNKMHCTGSTGNATTVLASEDKVLSGSVTITFSGCAEEAFPLGICQIHSIGQPDGTVVASLNAVAAMNGEEVYAKATSSELTTIQYLGEECPLNELEESLSGGIKIAVLDPLSLKKLHEVHILGEELGFGALSPTAGLHMLNEKKEVLPLILGSIEEVAGRAFSVHLVGL